MMMHALQPATLKQKSPSTRGQNRLPGRCGRRVLVVDIQQNHSLRALAELMPAHTTTMVSPQAFWTTCCNLSNTGVPRPVTASHPTVHFQPEALFRSTAFEPTVISV